MFNEPGQGPCPHKQNEMHDCLFRRANGPVICNFIDMQQVKKCDLYYRMCEVHDKFPELWTSNVCCQQWRMMMLRCIEPSGSYQGAVDIRIYPNDGKDVWRNYERLQFRFCPFCGEDK